MISLNLVANSTQYEQAVNQENQEFGFEEIETMCKLFTLQKEKECRPMILR
jgi:hypothetical protein